LSHALPIAVSYDSRSLDVSDANVVDCLRKQAKTRAVKLIKEVIARPEVGVTLSHLRGHEGADALAQVLHEPLMQHATSFGGGKSYISFPARNRQSADAASHNTSADSRGDTHLSGLKSLANAAMSGLYSLANAPLMSDEMENASARRNQRVDEDATHEPPYGGGHQLFTMNLQRVCEMCKASHDGSYGTGRFCSKSCRYEAHALRVAQQRRTNPGVPMTVASAVKLESLEAAAVGGTISHDMLLEQLIGETLAVGDKRKRF